MLRLDQASYCVDGYTLLQPISMDFVPGSVTAVLGPNGAGKSTLMRLLSGELLPSSGSVLLQGQPLEHWPALTRARCLAVLPQHSQLVFPFTVAEVVAMGRTPHNSGATLDGEIVEQALRALDVQSLKQRFYTHLSGGEKQRVQLARVLAQVWRADAQQARYLLLDEPTAALDIAHQQQALAAIRALAQRGCAVVMVLHDVNLAARFADQLVLLKQAELRASGSPALVLTAATIADVFDISARIVPHPQDSLPVVLL